MDVFSTLLKVILVLVSSIFSDALHCGENRLRITKIIGGKDSLKHEFPWQASIRWRVGMTIGEHFCGGALIHIKFVLTAAHCFDLGEDPAYYNVTLGAHDRSSPNALVQQLRIKRITLHEQYGISAKYDNDIALIELEEPVRLNSAINTICLPNFVDFEKPNTKCMISGWGKIDQEIDDLPNILQKAEVPIVGFPTCNGKLAYNGRLTRNMFCAGYKDGHIDSCVGDSGGPMQCLSSDGYSMLQGIVSFGEGCGKANKYGVYTVVRHYLQWIYQKSNGQIQIPKPRPPPPRPTSPPVKPPEPPVKTPVKPPMPPLPPVKPPMPPVRPPMPPVKPPMPPVRPPIPPVKRPMPPVKLQTPPVKPPMPPVKRPMPLVKRPMPPVKPPKPPVRSPMSPPKHFKKPPVPK